MCNECNVNQKTVSMKPKAVSERRRLERLGKRIVVKYWEPTKVCSVCNLTLDKSLFASYKDNRSVAVCIKCTAKKQADQFKDTYQTLPKRAKVLFHNASNRSKSKGVPFDLDEEWVLEKLSSGVCEVTNVPFDYTNKTFAPSMDRVEPSKGYTKDNTKVVIWIYNSAKGVGTHEDVMKLARALTNV